MINFSKTATTPVGAYLNKGGIDCSANPNYPAATNGWTYTATVAGKIGGASGTSVDAGDLIICKTDNAGGTQASVGTSWFTVEHNIVGPLLSANNLSDLTTPATARTNLGLGTAAVLDVSQSGGASKVAQFNAAANLVLSGTDTVGAAPAGSLIFQDLKEIDWLRTGGTLGANIFYNSAHDGNGGELQLAAQNRICIAPGQNAGGNSCLQLGSGTIATTIQIQSRGTATNGTQLYNSNKLWFPSNWWTGSASATVGVTLYGSGPSGVPGLIISRDDSGPSANTTYGTTLATINATGLILPGSTSGTSTIAAPAVAGSAIITMPNATSTLPILSQQVTVSGPTAARTWTTPDANFTLARTDAAQTFTGAQTMTSPVIANIAPGADFTITQNSVASMTLVNSGAVQNMIHAYAGANNNYSGGYVSLGGGASSETIQARVNPFEVWTNRPSFTDTAGDITLDNTQVLRIGRLSSTSGGSTGRTIWRQRQAEVCFDINPGSTSLTVGDSVNFIFNTSTGTKIGTGTTQKLGFWNATPIIQPSAAGQASITDSTGGVAASSLVDVTTTAVADPVKINANFATVNVLLLAIRTALVNSGLMKGAA